MSRPLILIADDDDRHRAMLSTLLAEWGYDSLEAVNGEEAVKLCLHPESGRAPDLALMDVRMPGKSGFEAFQEIHREKADLPVIIMTAYSELSAAVEAMRGGAYDYLTKPLDFPRLEAILRNAMIQVGLLQENATLNESLKRRGGKYELLGESAAMRSLGQLLRTIAPTEANILISGESGTGKELAARAIHQASRRADGPFVAVNCGALTETLLASELFGHEKGAFTGADKKHEGLFLQACGGSIFLDEIGEMPFAMQVKLLRVLQEREVLSVGGKKPEKIDCRIICATNRNLLEEIARGNFREDLYYRLNVAAVEMPPLRGRKDDIPLLAQRFAERLARENHKKFTAITPEAMSVLCEWRWPGNVRELENVIERAIILMPGEHIGLREMPEWIMEAKKREKPERLQPCESDARVEEYEKFEDMTLDEIERKVILRTLEKVGQNKTEAARILGITRKTLHARLNRYRELDADQE